MNKVLSIQAPLPGFAEATTLTLGAVDGALGLFSVASDQSPALRWFVLNAALYVPHYTPQFGPEVLAQIGSPQPDELSVLVVVTTAGDRPSVNLFAPLIVNSATGQCLQTMLETQDWPLRYELPAA